MCQTHIVENSIKTHKQINSRAVARKSRDAVLFPTPKTLRLLFASSSERSSVFGYSTGLDNMRLNIRCSHSLHKSSGLHCLGAFWCSVKKLQVLHVRDVQSRSCCDCR